MVPVKIQTHEGGRRKKLLKVELPGGVHRVSESRQYQGNSYRGDLDRAYNTNTLCGRYFTRPTRSEPANERTSANDNKRLSTLRDDNCAIPERRWRCQLTPYDDCMPCCISERLVCSKLNFCLVWPRKLACEAHQEPW